MTKLEPDGVYVLALFGNNGNPTFYSDWPSPQTGTRSVPRWQDNPHMAAKFTGLTGEGKAYVRIGTAISINEDEEV